MISIFASRLWRSKSPDAHLAPFSAVIRGNQIAERLGARLNPKEQYQADTCLYVKSYPPADEWGGFRRPPYLDVVDGYGLLSRLLAAHSEIPVIVCSETDRGTLGTRLQNPLTLIPQQHCNFEREPRTRRGVKVVGIIGTWYAWQFLPSGLEAALRERDLTLWQYSSFTCRGDVVDFYRNIDVQLVWRPYAKPLSNPLKLVNAAAFGVPTIAFAEPAFNEMADCYLPVETLGELLARLDRLTSSPQMYADYSGRGLEKAEAYHLDRIAARYRELDT